MVVGSVVVYLLFIVAPIVGVLFLFHALLKSALCPFQSVALLCLIPGVL